MPSPVPPPSPTPPRLVLQGISKQYPGVLANDRVELTVEPGQIHAVLGENGAGKSTLMKIIYGAVQPDDGRMLWNGQPLVLESPAQARALGISMVYQHFSLFDSLSAAENVWLGLDRQWTLPEVRDRIRAVSQTYGLQLDPDRPVHTLSVGERQRVEILRGLLTKPQLLILDEPTSVLTPQAVQSLFATLRQLADQGCAILYISHKLEEIRSLCHHCTVLRGGRVVAEVDPTQHSALELSRLMIGGEPPELSHRPCTPGEVLLSAQDLTLPRDSEFGTDLRHIRFELRAGEVLGIAGVSGNGQQALMAALSGEDDRLAPGQVRLLGQDGAVHDLAGLPVAERRRLGLGFVPEERLGRGAVPSLSLAQNTLLTRRDTLGPAGWVRPGRLAELAARLISRYQVRAAGPQAPARSLSGGNLQKFLMGRELDARPRVLLVAQPTWGVDVGASAQIRAELLALRDAGSAVLVVSEELEELFEISDRIMVMAQGQLSPALSVAEATVERIGLWMSGLWEGGHAAS